MSAKDTFREIVKHALIKDNWTITADPLYIRIEAIQMYIDVSAEKLISSVGCTERK